MQRHDDAGAEVADVTGMLPDGFQARLWAGMQACGFLPLVMMTDAGTFLCVCFDLSPWALAPAIFGMDYGRSDLAYTALLRQYRVGEVVTSGEREALGGRPHVIH